MGNKILPVAERATLATKYDRIMQMQNSIAFGNMKKAPDFEYAPDGDFYTDHHKIHLGYGKGTFDIFGVQDEADFYNASEYGRGHEEQHCRSTAQIPYIFGINRGCEVVLEYISTQVDKRPRRFISSRDYEKFINELPKMGVYISIPYLQTMISNLQNSLEDGRIERIRSHMFPGFEKLRVLYRARFWDNQPCIDASWDDVTGNPVLRLQVLTGAILSLSTTQLYQKGFLEKFGSTPLKKEVDALMPDIGKAYLATSTREMVKASINLTKKLAPYYYEACKISATDAMMRDALEQMIRDLIKKSLDLPVNPKTLDLSEKDEETDEGDCNSTFEHSDLVITLDDETFDKLAERSKKGSKGSGIMIRREHPKKEEQEDADSDGTSSGSDGALGDQNEGQSASSSNGSSNEDTGEDDSESSGSASGDSGKKKSSSNGPSDKDQSSEKKNPFQTEGGPLSSGEQSEVDSDNVKSSSSTQKPCAGKKNDHPCDQKDAASHIHGETSHEKVDQRNDRDVMESILKEAKEAASQMHAEAEDAISTINSCKQVTGARTAGHKEIPGGKPIDPKEMKDICKLQEITRQYKCTTKEPADVERRGKTLNWKNRQYFKSLSSPTVSYQDHGSIDPSLIYQLGMKESNIFRRTGKDYQFNGCAYMLIDNSGSMGLNKRYAACKEAAVIEDGFDGILPMKIVAFDDTYDSGLVVIHEVIKDWNERTKENGCWNFAKYGRYGSGNADAFDIQIATRELMARSEKKKLLVVLSDGAPAETSAKDTKAAIRQAHKLGITVCGIYFNEGCIGPDAAVFEDMYSEGDAAICCELGDIGRELEKVFRKFSRS